MTDYNSATEEQRRAAYDALAALCEGWGEPTGDPLVDAAFAALKPPSPLPSDKELDRIWGLASAGEFVADLVRARALYEHALRLAADECAKPPSGGPSMLSETAVASVLHHVEARLRALADEMKART